MKQGKHNLFKSKNIVLLFTIFINDVKLPYGIQDKKQTSRHSLFMFGCVYVCMCACVCTYTCACVRVRVHVCVIHMYVFKKTNNLPVIAIPPMTLWQFLLLCAGCTVTHGWYKWYEKSLKSQAKSIEHWRIGSNLEGAFYVFLTAYLLRSSYYSRISALCMSLVISRQFYCAPCLTY